jgi:hypothetical protein
VHHHAVTHARHRGAADTTTHNTQHVLQDSSPLFGTVVLKEPRYAQLQLLRTPPPSHQHQCGTPSQTTAEGGGKSHSATPAPSPQPQGSNDTRMQAGIHGSVDRPSPPLPKRQICTSKPLCAPPLTPPTPLKPLSNPTCRRTAPWVRAPHAHSRRSSASR